jgi:hypothetical protein
VLVSISSASVICKQKDVVQCMILTDDSCPGDGHSPDTGGNVPVNNLDQVIDLLIRILNENLLEILSSSGRNQ